MTGGRARLWAPEPAVDSGPATGAVAGPGIIALGALSGGCPGER